MSIESAKVDEEPEARRVERLIIGVWEPPAGLLDAAGRVEGVRLASLAD